MPGRSAPCRPSQHRGPMKSPTSSTSKKDELRPRLHPHLRRRPEAHGVDAHGRDPDLPLDQATFSGTAEETATVKETFPNGLVVQGLAHPASPRERGLGPSGGAPSARTTGGSPRPTAAHLRLSRSAARAPGGAALGQRRQRAAGGSPEGFPPRSDPRDAGGSPLRVPLPKGRSHVARGHGDLVGVGPDRRPPRSLILEFELTFLGDQLTGWA